MDFYLIRCGIFSYLLLAVGAMTPPPAANRATGLGVPGTNFGSSTTSDAVQTNQTAIFPERPSSVDVSNRLESARIAAEKRRATQQARILMTATMSMSKEEMKDRKVFMTTDHTQNAVSSSMSRSPLGTGQLPQSSRFVDDNGDPIPFFIGADFIILDGQRFPINNGTVNVEGILFLVCNNTVGVASDFICCESNLYARDGKVIQCCGLDYFLPETEICCDGVYYDKVIDGQVAFCCGATYFLPPEEICCGGGPFLKEPSFDCCGDEPILTTLSACCGDVPVPLIPDGQCCGAIQIGPGYICCGGNAVVDEGMSCCGTTTYNPRMYECCDNRPVPLGGRHSSCGCFDPSVYICCSGNRFPRYFYPPSWRCCGGDLYNPKTHVCCYDRPVPIKFAPCNCLPSTYFRCCHGVGNRIELGTKCCGTQLYHPYKQACCNYVVYPKHLNPCARPTFSCYGVHFNRVTEVCCDGLVLPKKNGKTCCGSLLVDPSITGCCGRNPYQRSLFCCGSGNRIYHKLSVRCRTHSHYIYIRKNSFNHAY